MEPDWPRIVITLLTVAAFVLSAAGLWRARSGARDGVKAMNEERRLRDELLTEMQATTRSEDASHEAKAAANAIWHAKHEAAGLEAHDARAVRDGREFLAERIIHELDQGSRLDVVLVGLGLLCGLAASIWGTWLSQP